MKKYLLTLALLAMGVFAQAKTLVVYYNTSVIF